MFVKDLGIIGIGKIGSAILKRILKTKALDKDKIIIYDIEDDVLQTNVEEFKVDPAINNVELVKSSKYVLIAVIPQEIDKILYEIADHVQKEHVIISIAAGVSISHVQNIIHKEVGMFRIMTNTPALVGAAATVIAHNNIITEEDLQFVKKIFESLGMVFELDEVHLDAVTGLSGSGPAYIFIIIEALADGGVKMGLPRYVAQRLAAQTVLGSAKLLLETQRHPGELKDMVATPGGTTITAIHELESAKLRATLITAVEAATLKSKSLNSIHSS
jgi:pyrroline-5-carboxylate reductase